MIKYNIFPYYRCSIKTNMKPEEVYKKIREITIENRKMEQIHDEKKIFIGRIEQDRISVAPLARLNNDVRNNFAPKFEIRTSVDEDNQTIIKLKAKETVLSWIVFIIIFLCFYSLAVYATHLWWYILWFIFCIGVFEFSFWYPCKNAVEALQKIFENKDK